MPRLNEELALGLSAGMNNMAVGWGMGRAFSLCVRTCMGVCVSMYVCVCVCVGEWDGVIVI